jgi:hypothetical protein
MINIHDSDESLTTTTLFSRYLVGSMSMGTSYIEQPYGACLNAHGEPVFYGRYWLLTL